MNEMLLRGCLLKNSRWVLGLVVYAGPDSRIQMNTSRPPLKAGSLDRYLNKQIAILILFQLALSVATGVASWAWRENVGRLRPHLALDDPTQGNWQPKGQFIGLATLTAWILYSYLVPISLFVTMEIVKYTQALLYINRDPRLSTADRDTPSSAEGDKSSRSTTNAGRSEPVESGQARNSALNEDLGRVGWVFSDKTGTLTQNDMRLRQLSLRGAVVGAPPTAFRIEEADQAPGRDMLGAWDAELLQAFEQLLPHGPSDEGPWQELMRSAGQAGTGKGAGLCRSTAASEANATQPQQGHQGSQPGQRQLATQFLDMMLALMTCHNVIIEPTASHTHADPTSVNQSAGKEAKHQRGNPGCSCVGQGCGCWPCKHAPSSHEGEQGGESRGSAGMSDKPRLLPGDHSGVLQADRQQCAAPPASAEHSVALTTRQSKPRPVKAESVLQGTPAGGREDKQQTPNYQGPSPDEVALVEGAWRLGFRLESRSKGGHARGDRASGQGGGGGGADGGQDTDQLHLSLLGRPLRVGLLNVLEFSSDRKRMSVVIRAPNGRLVAFVKGADSAMLPLLRPDTPEEVLEATQRDLSFFATQGLRTLVVGARQLDPAWYARWDEGYQSAAAALHDRDEKVSAAALELEKELELVGLTAIEDRLQEGVPEALQSLLAAGIKVWMITGDKRETAINIAVSAALFSSADGLMTLAVDNSADAKVAILDLLNKTKAQRTANPAPDLGPQSPPPLPTGAPKAHTGQGGHARDLEGEGTRQSSFAHLLSPGRQKSHGQPRPAAGVGEGTQGGLLQGPLPPAGPGGPQHHPQTSQEEPGQQSDRAKARSQGPAQAQSKGSKSVQGAVSRAGVGLARGMELVIDGKALNHVLPDPGLRRSLALLCSRCSAVLVCRASPAQKATIVNMMRAYVLEQLLGPGSAADGAVGDPVVSAQPHEPSGCCANCLHTLHTALARGVAWCSRVMKSYTRGRQLLKAPIMLAIGDGANDVAMLQAADVGVGLMGREGRQAANSADYVLPNFRHLIPLLFVHGSLCRHRLARLASYSFYKNVAFWAVLFAFQPFCGWSGQAIVDDISAAVYNVVFTALPILMFALLDRHAPDADLLATPRLYQARGAALASSEFWMSGVLLGLAHGVVSFFVPFLAITMDGIRPSNGMAVVGKAVYVALLGAVTLELAATSRHWTRLYAAILLLSYFLIFPFLAIFPYAERAVGYFDPTYLGVVPLPLFANPHFWLSIFAVYVATFGTRLVALGFNWLVRPTLAMRMAQQRAAPHPSAIHEP
ncbi:hypothetical protein V8C86DRAFT_2461703 [Haematococcus lacustris]